MFCSSCPMLVSISTDRLCFADPELTSEEARIVSMVQALAERVETGRGVGPMFSAHGSHALRLILDHLSQDSELRP